MLARPACNAGVMNDTHSTGGRWLLRPHRRQEDSSSNFARRPGFIRKLHPINRVFLLPFRIVGGELSHQFFTTLVRFKPGDERDSFTVVEFTNTNCPGCPKLC